MRYFTILHVATVRNLADRGLIKAQRDFNNWRVFAPEEVEKFKRLPGMEIGEPAPADTERVGMNA